MLHAKQRRASTSQGVHHLLDGFRVLPEVLSVRGEAPLDVMPEVSMRISRSADVDVLDAVLCQRFGELRLREAALPRERKFANINHSIHAGALQKADELIKGFPFIADGEELHGLSRDRHAHDSDLLEITRQVHV